MATIGTGSDPTGIAVTPDGTRVYAVNRVSDNVSVIDASTNAVVATIRVGDGPNAYGNFIGPSVMPGTTSSVVEFYHAAFDHYFITWMPAEIAILDAGTQIAGWARTTGYNTIFIDGRDPFAHGFSVV